MLIPLVMPADSDDSTEATVGTDLPELLNPGETADWNRVYSGEYPAAWRSTGQQNAFPVTLHHELRASGTPEPQFVVMKSVVRGSQLVTSITGVYSKRIGSALFSAPADAEVIEGYIGREHAATLQARLDLEASDRVDLDRLNEAEHALANLKAAIESGPDSAAGRNLPPDFVGAQATRILVQERRFRERRLWGRAWIRAQFTPSGARSSLPAYLPVDAKAALPLDARLDVKVIAAVDVREDAYETHPLCLRIGALSRVVS